MILNLKNWNTKQTILGSVCGYATRMRYLVHVSENKKNDQGVGGLYKIALSVKHPWSHFIWRNFFSLIHTLINILFWCWFISAWNTFYLAATPFPPKMSNPEICYQHVAQSEVQILIEWGQDFLPYDTCSSDTPRHPLGSQLGNSDTSTYPPTVVRDRARHTATPRTKSIALDLEVDRG